MIYLRILQTAIFFFGLASVVLGALGLALEKPVRGYQIVMILLPLFAVCFIVLRKWRNIPTRGKRNLANGKVVPLLVASVNPRDYPPCPHLSMSHANAVSIAGLSSRNVFLRISQLIMIMIRENQELNPREKVFSINVVETHLTLLRSIHSTMVNLSSDCSLVSECYRLLRGGDKVMTVVDKAGFMMESAIIRRMEKFLQSVPTGVERNAEVDGYKDKIRKLIKEEIPGKLIEVMAELIAVQQTSREILEEMQVDWQHDIQDCQKDYYCTPVRIEDFRPKERMKIDSVEKTVARWLENTMPNPPKKGTNNKKKGA